MSNEKVECFQAIENAYTSLKKKRLPDKWNIDVGMAIYKFHYPKTPRNIAMEDVVSLLKGNTLSKEINANQLVI